MDLPLEAIFDPDSFQIIEQSPVSYVTKARFWDDHPDCPGQLVAIKSASILPECSKEPHDISKEVEILSKISHCNVIDVLGRTFERAINTIHFWMPFIPHSLHEILSSPTFSPHPFPGGKLVRDDYIERRFVTVSRSVLYQTLSALAYLHDPARGIALRDIKPRNILLTEDGCVKLIDFGIAWDQALSRSSDVLWAEYQGCMCTEIGTGAYRSPETIFGDQSYDPFAVDLWSLGALLAEFFTSVRFTEDYDEEEEFWGDLSGADVGDEPYIIPDDYKPNSKQRKRGSWRRTTLFDADRGALGLAWSIFKTRGSPNKENWPSFNSLPNAEKVVFQDAPPIDLRLLLPNLPPSIKYRETVSHNITEQPMSCSPLDLVHRFLVYEPSRRLKASDALRHPWMVQEPVLLPLGHPGLPGRRSTGEWQGQTLGELLWPAKD